MRRKKRKDSPDISADELLRQLKDTTAFDKVELPDDIEMPKEDDEPAIDIFAEPAEKKPAPRGPVENDPEAEAIKQRYLNRSKAKDDSPADKKPDIKESEDDSSDISPSSTAEGEEESTEIVFSEPTVEEEPKSGSTKEFDAVDSSVADIPDYDTSELELNIEESLSAVDVDALMKKYLSEAEYNEVIKTRESTEIPSFASNLQEAEEYVSSIESEIEKDGPAEPATETQKVLSEMDLSAVVQKGEEFDETDANLMIAFGMHEELEEKLGGENAQIVKEALDKDAETFASVKRDADVPDEIDKNLEFESAVQIKEVFNIYKKQYRNILIKFYLSLIGLVAVFIFENLVPLGGSLPTWLDPQVFPVIYSMVSLQLLFFACLPAIKPILRGFGSLFSAKPTAYSLLSVAMLFSVAYHIAMCFVYSGGSMNFCNLPIVLCIVLTVLSELLTLKRDIFTFNIVASKRVKHVIAKIPEEQVVAEHEIFDEYIDEDASIFRVSKASFVDGFFRRTRAYNKGKGVLGIIIALCVVISAFFLVYTGFVQKSWNSAVYNAYLAIVIACPLSAFITFSYPMYRAAKVAFENGSAIVGESSLEEYSNAGAVSFDDRDVFPSSKAKVKSIKIYGNNRIDRIIYNVASLFKVLGGPLCDVFSIVTKEFECSDDVEIVDISPDGIEAVISGKHIFYGKASYLIKNNFEPMYERDDERIEFSGEASISYLVCNDEVAAKLYIHYSIDPEFVAVSKQLHNAGMCIGIKSFDPNIDDSLLGKYINLSRYAVKVIKCRYLTEKTTVEDRSDSGIVSKKNPKSLLKTLALCDKVNSVTKTSLLITALSIFLAFAVTFFGVFKGNTGASFSGLYIAAYQLFWVLPILAVSTLNIKK